MSRPSVPANGAVTALVSSSNTGTGNRNATPSDLCLERFGTPMMRPSVSAVGAAIEAGSESLAGCGRRRGWIMS